MPKERVQTEVIPLDNYCLVGYHGILLGSLCMAKSTDSKVGFPTILYYRLFTETVQYNIADQNSTCLQSGSKY